MSTTTTISPTVDAFLGSSNPTTNYGTNAKLYIGEQASATATYRSLILPSFSAITAPVHVISAKLRLYANEDLATNARTMRVYRMLVDWNVSQATWNIRKTGTNWGSAGGFGVDDCEQTDIGSRANSAAETLNQYKEVTLDAAKIQEMINGTFTNNGLMIKMDTETDDLYGYASYNAGSNTPQLVIEHEPLVTSGEAVVDISGYGRF